MTVATAEMVMRVIRIVVVNLSGREQVPRVCPEAAPIAACRTVLQLRRLRGDYLKPCQLLSSYSLAFAGPDPTEEGERP